MIEGSSQEAVPAVDELAREVAALRDLFNRRLLEDRDKKRLYDELYAQLEFARSGLLREYLAPLARELLLLADRLESEGDDDFRTSVVTELLEPFYRRGLVDIATDGPFDPATHEVGATVATTDETKAGSIVAVERLGFLLGDRLLRPARVTIAVATADPSAETGATGLV